ncbi:MAG TPA: DUF2807 domain-containing protein [Caulobacterales bacterium]|nr:DUF2807 domain-containing protein [Caulobacterales bacterium]
MRSVLAAVSMLAAFTVAASAETRSVGPFNAVEARGRFRVEVIQGPTRLVEITGPDAQRVAARVHGDELVLSPVDRNWFGPEPEINAVVHVTVTALESLQASRGAEIEARDVHAGQFNADASMGGVLRVSGGCARLEAAASMGGQIDAGALNCTDVRADASMGGSMRVTARNAIEAHASMGGVVAVSGEPSRRETHSIMGGEVSFN